MDKEIRILIAEDSAADAELITRELGKMDFAHTLKWIKSKKEFLPALGEYAPDIILCDYKMPSLEAPEALEIVKERSPETPLIVVSGTIGEDIAVEMMKLGAVDYVMKDKLSKLVPALQRALKEAREHAERQSAETSLKDSEEKLKILFECAPDGYYLFDVTGTFLDGNHMAQVLSGYQKEELIGQNFLKLKLLPLTQLPKAAAILAKNALGQATGPDELTLIKKDGTRTEVEIRNFPVKIKDKRIILGIARDITERKKAEDALRQSEAKLQSILDNISIGVAIISPDMEILSLNRQMRKWNPHIDLKDKHICYRSFNQPPREDICTYCPTAKTLKDGLVHESVTKTPRGDQVCNYRVVASPIKDVNGKVVAVIEMVEDVTGQKKTEEELQKRLQELEVFYKASVGREERILELKKEVEQLKKESRK